MLRLARTSPRHGGLPHRAREVEQVRGLGLVELERARDRAEHLVGDALEAAALEAGVVVDAHPGEHRHLLAAQPGTRRYPPPGRFTRSGLIFALRDRKVADLLTLVHAATVRRAVAARTGPAGTWNDRACPAVRSRRSMEKATRADRVSAVLAGDSVLLALALAVAALFVAGSTHRKERA